PANLQEKERTLAMEQKLPAGIGADVFVFIVSRRDERFAVDIAHRIEARATTCRGIRIKGDQQVVNVVHATVEALPQRAQVLRNLQVTAMCARVIGTVVPDDVRMAQLEKGLDLNLAVRRVATVMNETITRVQITDGFSSLDPSDGDQQFVVASHGVFLRTVFGVLVLGRARAS